MRPKQPPELFDQYPVAPYANRPEGRYGGERSGAALKKIADAPKTGGLSGYGA